MSEFPTAPSTRAAEERRRRSGQALLVWLGLGLGSVAASATGVETHTYAWTAQERIASIVTPRGRSRYNYDGDGLRIRKETPEETVVYIRDPQGNVIAEYDGGGQLLAEYVYAGGERIAKLAGDQRLFYHTDGVGTPLAITNHSGQLVWRGENLPFGREHASTGPLDDWKFTGKELDRDTALHYFEARHHDAGIGRFVSTDEVRGDPAAPQTWNRYAYSLNNPLRFVDPDGKQEAVAATIPEETAGMTIDVRPFDGASPLDFAREGWRQFLDASGIDDFLRWARLGRLVPEPLLPPGPTNGGCATATGTCTMLAEVGKHTDTVEILDEVVATTLMAPVGVASNAGTLIKAGKTAFQPRLGIGPLRALVHAGDEITYLSLNNYTPAAQMVFNFGIGVRSAAGHAPRMFPGGGPLTMQEARFVEAGLRVRDAVSRAVSVAF